jgi:hypothetical protein
VTAHEIASNPDAQTGQDRAEQLVVQRLETQPKEELTPADIFQIQRCKGCKRMARLLDQANAEIARLREAR